MVDRIETTAKGFEPLRAEPNGCLVHHLYHSVTLSMYFLLLASSNGGIPEGNENAASEDRTHDLWIMRPARCQLRYCHLTPSQIQQTISKIFRRGSENLQA